jgi:hypothetical protein
MKKINCLHLKVWLEPVLRIRDVYPGSEIFPSRIPDEKIPDPGSVSSYKIISIFSTKTVSKLSENDLGY